MLLDTGSDITTIREDCLPPGIKKFDCNLSVRVANNTHITLTKQVNLPIKLCNNSTRIRVYVFPKRVEGHPIILGADVLRKLKINLCFQTEKLIVQARQSECFKENEPFLNVSSQFVPSHEISVIRTAHAPKDLEIEANSAVMVKVKIKAADQTDLLVTRSYLNEGALIIPDSLTTVKVNQALIQILNISAT